MHLTVNIEEVIALLCSVKEKEKSAVFASHLLFQEKLFVSSEFDGDENFIFKDFFI